MLYYLTTIIFMAVLLPKSFYDFGITRKNTHFRKKRFALGVFHILCHRLRGGGISEIVTLLNKLI